MFHRLLHSSALRASLILVSLCGLVACNPRSSPDPEVVRQNQSWDWNHWPRSKNLPLTDGLAQVEARRSHRFQAPTDGKLVLAITTPKAVLEEGVIWATMSAEALELEEQVLRQRRTALELRHQLKQEIELPQRLLELETQAAKLQRELDVLQAIQSSLDDAGLIAELLPEYASLTPEDEIARLTQSLALIAAQQALLEKTGTGETDIEHQLAEGELRQAELELQVRRQQQELRMPFAGTLFCNLDLTQNGRLHLVKGGQLIGVAEDRSELYASVKMQDSQWLELPPETVFFRIQTGSGAVVDARFARVTVAEEMQRATLFYRFRFPPETANHLESYVNSFVNGQLYQQIPDVAHLVPKRELLERYPEVFASGDWKKGVAQLWPDATTVGVGAIHVAIRPPAE